MFEILPLLGQPNTEEISILNLYQFNIVSIALVCVAENMVEWMTNIMSNGNIINHFKWSQRYVVTPVDYLNNYFDFHVRLSIRPSVRPFVRLVPSAQKLISKPASVSQNVTNKSCMIHVKSEKYASLVTLRPQ